MCHQNAAACIDPVGQVRSEPENHQSISVGLSTVFSNFHKKAGRAKADQSFSVLTGLAIFALVISTMLASGGSAWASSGWKVLTIEGDAKIIKEGVQPAALNTGDVVAEGDRIVTGETGRAIITRDGSTIVVAPGTEMSIPVEKSEGLTTRILQKVGTLFLNVQKKKTEHFEVVTPYLAAVVKGTSFTVNVDRSGAAVHVMEGLVQVADSFTGQELFVRPGQTATRGAASAGLDLKGKKAAAPGSARLETPEAAANDADTGTTVSAEATSRGTEKAGSGNVAAGTVIADTAKTERGIGETVSSQAISGGGITIGETLGVVSVDVSTVTSALPGSATGLPSRPSTGTSATTSSGSTGGSTAGTTTSVASVGGTTGGSVSGGSVGSSVGGI